MTDYYLVSGEQRLRDIAQIIEEQYDAAVQHGDGYTLAERIRILALVRDCRADLAAFAKKVEGDVLLTAGEKRFVVDGIGEVEIRRSVKRSQWDNDGLTRLLVARALDERIVDERTGEYEPAWEAVARVLSECARPSWRVTPLRTRGIQPDEFCREEPDGWSVQLPPRKETT